MTNIGGNIFLIWTPPHDEHWWEHLPDEGAHTWKQRASRRHGQSILRIAFIPAKFRLGIEPDPFCMEMDLARIPYTLRDITDILLVEGITQTRQARDTERQKLEDAAFALCRVLKQRSNDNPLLVGDAKEFLVATGLTWTQARNLLHHGENGIKWEICRIPGRRGNAKGVYPLGDEKDVQNKQASQNSHGS